MRIFRNNCLLSREGQHFHNRRRQLTVFVQTQYIASLMMAAAMVFAGCSKDDDAEKQPDTPPYAASTQTWTFGTQTWSDAIQMPDCNKETFDGGTSVELKADGRRYTEDGHTWYYYSWPYVDAHKSTMCPSPWRVPTVDDILTLADNAAAADLIAAWAYGGRCFNDGSLDDQGSTACYWSSTANYGGYAFHLYYDSYIVGEDSANKHSGFQVRCVK